MVRRIDARGVHSAALDPIAIGSQFIEDAAALVLPAGSAKLQMNLAEQTPYATIDLDWLTVDLTP